MRNILITGGGSPLGREIAETLSKKNKVIVTTRKRDYDANNRFEVITEIDLLKSSDLKILFAEIGNSFKYDFSVINCTGYYDTGQKPFLELTLEEDNKIFDANYKTVYNTAKTLLPLMIKQGGGHFISFSCNSVNHNYPWMIPYTNSKTAIESLTKGLANEFSQHGIFANCLQMSTLRTNEEINKKPFGDHNNWLQVSEIANFIQNLLDNNHPYFNGNIVQLFKYSDTYFNQSYFDRIKR